MVFQNGMARDIISLCDIAQMIGLQRGKGAQAGFHG